MRAWRGFPASAADPREGPLLRAWASACKRDCRPPAEAGNCRYEAMSNGVQPTDTSPWRAVSAGVLLLGSLFMLTFASSALAVNSGSASPAGKGYHNPSQPGGASGCTDMCGGCTEGGGESLTKTPTFAPEAPIVTPPSAPVVTPPSAPATTTPTGGETIAKATVLAPVPVRAAPAVRPPLRSVTKAKKPVEKFVTRHLKKHHSSVRHGATEQSLARPPLAGSRAAFTG